jgi:hypothetical protein
MSELRPIAIFEKDPSAVLDFVVDWSEFLPESDSIQSVTATATAGITIASSQFSGKKHVIWLSGGTDGTSYLVTSRVTSTEGRVDERTFEVAVRNL